MITFIGFYEPYHDISSVFISNKTVSVASKSGGGEESGQNCIVALLFLQPG